MQRAFAAECRILRTLSRACDFLRRLKNVIRFGKELEVGGKAKEAFDFSASNIKMHTVSEC